MDFIDFHTHRPTAEGVITPRSFAIHPYNADKEPAKTFQQFSDSYLTKFKETQIIGECGLDRICSSDWQRQLELFDWQLQIAELQQKPVIIHCVHAIDTILSFRKTYTSTPWVFHGFTGSLTTAEQLTRANIFPSFGAAILDQRRIKVRDTLARIPNPFFLETDTSQIQIEKIYQETAILRKTTVPELVSTIKKFYNTLLKCNN